MDANGLDIEALRKAVTDEAERLKRSEGKRSKEDAPRTEKVLGGMFELSPSLASAVNVAVNWLQPTVRRFVENGIRTSAAPMLKKAGLEGEAALRTANVMADAAGWALTFYDEAGGLVGDTRKHFKELGELKQRFSRVNVAHGGQADSMSALKGNELVGVELRRVNMHLHTNLLGEACKLLSSAPQAYIKVLDKNGMGKTASMQRIKGESIEDWVARIKRIGPQIAKETNAVDSTIRELLEPYKSELSASGMTPYEQRTSLKNIEAELRKEITAEKASEVDEKTIRELLVPIGAIASVAAKDALLKGRSDEAAGLKTTALDMIEKLSDTVINDKNAKSVGGLSFDAYIRKILDTHQENMGQPHIGKRFDEKMDYACKEIARAITEGRMHPMALVNLVGERKVVKEMGKHIASREEVTQALDEQIKLMPAKFAVDAEEYITEAAVTEKDIKHAVDTLPEKDRAFFVSLLPEEVAKKVGVKDEEIKVAHDMARDGFAEHLAQAALDLATLSDEKLKEAKLSEAEIKLIREIAPQAKEGHLDRVLDRVTKKGQFKDTLDTTVVNAMGANLIQHPGALYEQSGHKLYGEHEHPGGDYLDEGSKKDKDKEKKKPLEKNSAAHGLGDDEEEDALSERKPASMLRPSKSHAHTHDSWDALEDGDEPSHKPSKHKPDSHIHHAHHEGRQHAHDRHLG